MRPKCLRWTCRLFGPRLILERAGSRSFQRQNFHLLYSAETEVRSGHRHELPRFVVDGGRDESLRAADVGFDPRELVAADQPAGAQLHHSAISSDLAADQWQ